MSTINISLPSQQVDFIDALVKTHGFANRSEFVRAIIRLLKSNPTLISKTAVFPFAVPTETSRKKIMKEFRKSKKYSSEFLKDIKEGLPSSDYFIS